MLDEQVYEHFIQLLPKGISNSLKEAFKQNATVVELQKGDTLFNENRKKVNEFWPKDERLNY